MYNISTFLPSVLLAQSSLLSNSCRLLLKWRHFKGALYNKQPARIIFESQKVQCCNFDYKHTYYSMKLSWVAVFLQKNDLKYLCCSIMIPFSLMTVSTFPLKNKFQKIYPALWILLVKIFYFNGYFYKGRKLHKFYLLRVFYRICTFNKLFALGQRTWPESDCNVLCLRRQAYHIAFNKEFALIDVDPSMNYFEHTYPYKYKNNSRLILVLK